MPCIHYPTVEDTLLHAKNTELCFWWKIHNLMSARVTVSGCGKKYEKSRKRGLGTGVQHLHQLSILSLFFFSGGVSRFKGRWSCHWLISSQSERSVTQSVTEDMVTAAGQQMYHQDTLGGQRLMRNHWEPWGTQQGTLYH